MRTTLFCSAVDLADAGPAAALADAVDRAGSDALTVAVTYHEARDLLPHARRRRIRRLPAGLWLRRDPAVWDGGAVQPPRAGDDATEAGLAELVDLARARGVVVDAWSVFLHVDGDGADGAPGAHRNAFGDPYPEQLCPASPEARDYAVRIARAAARAGLGEVLAESLHHHGLEHGVHHERYLFDPGPVGRFLLGLCLCRHCRAAVDARGGDGDALRDEIAHLLDQSLAAGRALDGDVDTRAAAANLCDGALGVLLDAREATVTTLIAEVAAACAEEGSTLMVLDSSGAAKGYADGLPSGDPAPAMAWRFGLDLAAIAPHAGVQAIAYARDPERVAADLAAYRTTVGPDARLGVIVRPMAPDCDDTANLREKVAAARAAGCVRLDLYHYGLMPLPVLDRVRAALA